MKKFRVGSRPDPLSEDLLAALARSHPATYGHLTDFGFPHKIKPLIPCAVFAGPALTVQTPHLDSSAVHHALSLVRPGDVIVIDQSGDNDRSSFGGTLAAIAQDKGAIAAVTNGRTNDLNEILELGFPMFSRGVTAKTSRIIGLEGGINVPVSIGGVVVMPGDIVLGACDGLCVIPRGDAEEVANKLTQMENNDTVRTLRQSVRDGCELGDILGAAAHWKESSNV